MRSIMITGLAAVLLAIAPALAAPVIQLEDYELLANTADQAIQIQVFSSPADQMGGLNFNIQVNQSGAPVMDLTGPKITKTGFPSGLDCITGTIFDGNHNAPTDVDGSPDPDAFAQFEGVTFTTAAGTVEVPDTPALLATVTFDTTGITSGTWDLSLIETMNGPTNFAGVQADITDGTIRVGPPVEYYDVPEPATVVLVSLGGLGLAWWRRRAVARV